MKSRRRTRSRRKPVRKSRRVPRRVRKSPSRNSPRVPRPHRRGKKITELERTSKGKKFHVEAVMFKDLKDSDDINKGRYTTKPVSMSDIEKHFSRLNAEQKIVVISSPEIVEKTDKKTVVNFTVSFHSNVKQPKRWIKKVLDRPFAKPVGTSVRKITFYS
jgi:hypothetical protein